MAVRLLPAGIVAICLTVGVQYSPSALADPYPSRPITIVVPFPPGGSLDPLTRIVAERMKASLGQPVVVENVSGAGGSLGVARAARAAPDGYTLSAGNSTSHVGAGAVYPASYDVLSDFVPIARLTDLPMLLVASNNVPARNVRELIGWLEQHPDRASAATIGAGSPANLCLVNFQNRTHTRFQLVPYRGGALAAQDVIGGQVDLMCGEGMNLLPHVLAGRVKALAVMSESRWFAAPDLPTIAEAGVPGLSIRFWSGLWAPKGTPSDIVAKLNAVVRGALTDPAARQRLANLGNEIPPPELLTPDALAAFHRTEIEKWWPIIKAANIKAE